MLGEREGEEEKRGGSPRGEEERGNGKEIGEEGELRWEGGRDGEGGDGFRRGMRGRSAVGGRELMVERRRAGGRRERLMVGMMGWRGKGSEGGDGEPKRGGDWRA